MVKMYLKFENDILILMHIFFERSSKITWLLRDELTSNRNYELTLSIDLVENDQPN